MYDIMHLPGVIEIGKTGENLFRKIEFDLRPWLAEMPDGVGSIVHIRPGETGDDAYVAATTMGDGILTWILSAGDIGDVEGYGQMEVWLEDLTGARGKSARCQTFVRSSLAPTSETPPEAQEAWLEQMTGLKTETVLAAQSAEDAKEAAESAQTAAEAARDAAQAVAGDFQGLSATASGLAAGTSPTVNVTHDEGGLFNLAFGIPKGDKGDQGDPPTDSQVQTAANNYLSQVITNPDSPPLDRALSSNAAAAPADMVGDLKSAIKDITGVQKIENIVKGYYIATNGSTYDVSSPVENGGYCYAVVDASEGDCFTITGTGGSTPRLWAFGNSNGGIISKSDANAEESNYVIVAPAGTSKLILNSYQNVNPVFYIGNLVKNQIRDLQGEDDTINFKIDVISKRSNNLFDKVNPIVQNTVLNSSRVVTVNNNARTVIIPVDVTSDSYVTVTRTVMSSRFGISKFTTYPNVGETATGSLSDNSAESLTISVNSATKYIAVYLWLATSDTVSLNSVLNGLMAEYGQEYTEYTEPYRPYISEKQKNEIIGELEDATTEPQTTDVPLTFESVTAFRSKTGGLTTYSGVSVAKIAVTSGQKYEIISRNYYDAAYAFFEDSSHTFLQSLWLANNSQEIRVVVEIPQGVSYLAIQRIYAHYPTTAGLVTGIELIPAKSILNGKKLTLIGDSITEKNFRARVNWALNLHVWCGAVIQNLGVGGTGFKAGVDHSQNYYARISQIQASPDVIGIALSWNDMGDGTFPIGTATDTGTSSLAGYANDFLDALITAYPTTPIISYSQGPWWSYHPGIERSDEWIGVYKQICALKGIPFYSDLYDGCTLKPWLLASRQAYYTSDDPDAGNTGVVDDVHPNSEGHKVIARILYPKFAQNLVTTGIDYE